MSLVEVTTSWKLIGWICLIAFHLSPSESSPCPPEDQRGERYVMCEARASKYYRMECFPQHLLGFPDPHYKVHWTFNGKSGPWPYGSSSFIMEEEGTLESSATSTNDAGNYTCTVTSSNGTSASREFNLCVTISADFGKPPFVMETPENPKIQRVLPGYKTSFQCNASVGNPSCLNPYNYTIEWWRSEAGVWIPLRDSEDIRIISAYGKKGNITSQLEFKKVKKSHYGTYNCVVRNAYGTLNINYTLERGVDEAEYFTRMYQIAIVMVGLLFIMPVAVCFCRRFRLVIALYYKEKTTDNSLAGRYKYDIYVVCGETAIDWVYGILLPTLEETYGYKCLIPDRNFIPGDIIIDAIASNVSKCRRVIVVITPCLLRDQWSAWAIHHALKAAMNTPTRILPLVLQDIKEKYHYADPYDLMKTLKMLMARKLKVPYACQMKATETLRDSMKYGERAKDRKEEKEDLRKEDLKQELSKSLILGTPEETKGTLRSRSKSPKIQEFMNIISATKEVSKGRKLDGKSAKSYTDYGGQITGCKTTSDPYMNFEEPTEGGEEPGTPCSITPFIFRQISKSQRREDQSSSWLWRSIQLVFVGNEEHLFWQTLRIRLSSPLKNQLAGI